MLSNLMKFMCADENKARPDWVIKSFPIIKIVILSLLILLSIVMIVLVVMQKSNTNGVSAISGQTNTFYNKNKKTTLQGIVKLLTIITSVAMMVLCILFLILNTIYSGTI